MSSRTCPNGHVVDASWDRCPYCPAPSQRTPQSGGGHAQVGTRPARAPIPPTVVSLRAPAGFSRQTTTPTPASTSAPRRPPAGPRHTVEISTEKANQQARPVVAWLVIITGDQKGEDFRLREGKNSIGSDPDCDIVIRDAYVSGHHANIHCTTKEGERVYILRDLDSINGTYLNNSDEPVYHDEIIDADAIVFARTRTKFKCL
jgi:pSer/pThr/pTyr-binding forkhead associated (FHA) protein